MKVEILSITSEQIEKMEEPVLIKFYFELKKIIEFVEALIKYRHLKGGEK